MIINNPNRDTETLIIGGDMDEGKEGLRAAAEEMLNAMESKDVEGLVQALQSFFYMCDEMPHEEGPEPEGMHEGGWVFPGEKDPYGVDPVTDQEAQAEYFGERYR